VTQTYNTCAETHLGGGVMSPFVSPLSAIARARNPTAIGSVALRKGPRRFCPHRSNHCHALMLTCRNSLLRQHCEHCNNVLSSFGQRGHHVMCINWNEPQVSRLQLYKHPIALNSTTWWMQIEVSKGQSRTCYQECGCHFIVRTDRCFI